MSGIAAVEASVAGYALQVDTAGFAIAERVIDRETVERLRAAIAAIPQGEEVRRKRNVYGVRNLLQICAPIRELAMMDIVRQWVTPILGNDAFATRAVFFDKVAGANWVLGWHQDSVISVAERRDVPGFLAWSNKAGVWQVQPPPDVMAGMLAIRVHLDDCGHDNGPLRVIPGSHRDGWVDDSIDRWKADVPAVTCTVQCGGIVAMRPLLLHASSRAATPTHRRVIHIEYASQNLPGGLEWNIRVGTATVCATISTEPC